GEPLVPAHELAHVLVLLGVDLRLAQLEERRARGAHEEHDEDEQPDERGHLGGAHVALCGGEGHGFSWGAGPCPGPGRVRGVPAARWPTSARPARSRAMIRRRLRISGAASMRTRWAPVSSSPVTSLLRV